MTKQELELQFEIEKGYSKDQFRPDDYYEWVEKKLIEKLNEQKAQEELFTEEVSQEYVG